jgi:hypothetical protein
MWYPAHIVDSSYGTEMIDLYLVCSRQYLIRCAKQTLAQV